MTTGRTTSRRRLAAAALLVALGLAAAAARAEPAVKLSIGYGPASDVTLALLAFNPQLASHLGKSYALELQEFRGTDMRFRAYLSGAIVGSTGSSKRRHGSGEQRHRPGGRRLDLQGKRQGLSHHLYGARRCAGPSARRSQGQVDRHQCAPLLIELWARLAVQKAGFDSEHDVRYAVVEFPLQGQALRSGQLDVGAFPQPFFTLEQIKPGLRTLFTTHDILPFYQETQLLFFKRELTEKSPGAICDFLADLAAATRFYLDQSDEARRLLLKEKVIRMPDAAYLQMRDYYRARDLRVDIGSMEKMQDIQIKNGFQDKPVDFKKIIDLGLLPN